jgi:1,4-dihydroxy-2-naphthoate octaprenyltransferase
MNLRQFFGVIELKTKVISLSSIILGTQMGFVQSGSFRPLEFSLFLISGLLIDMGTTAFNTFFDYYRGEDRKTNNFEKDKVLVHEKLIPGHTFILGLSLFLAALIPGIWLASLVSWWLIPFGATALLVGFLYSGGPKPLSSTPLGEVFAGLFMGTIIISIGVWSQGVLPQGRLLLASVPNAIFIAMILMVNNLSDYTVDLANKRLTLAGLIGQPLGKAYLLLGNTLAYGALARVYPKQIEVLTLGLSLSALILILFIHRPFTNRAKARNMSIINGFFILQTFFQVIMIFTSWGNPGAFA